MCPDCQPSKQEMVQDSMESFQEALRASVNEAKAKSLAQYRDDSNHMTTFICRDLLEQCSRMALLWKRLCLLSGTHLLFIEQLEHLGPRETGMCGVSPVSGQQITWGGWGE